MDNPDDKATAEAAAVLQRMFGDRHHMVADKDAKWITFCIVNRWIQARTHNWAVRRGTPKCGNPDAMTVGFAEASLKLIADKASGLPWNEPLGSWARNDVAQLFAFAHECIEASRIRTLEDPTMEEVGA